MLTLIFPVLAYLAGSISSAVVVCRLMGLPDPRHSGSNNPGATNVLRLGGKKAAAITLVSDLLKGLLPVVAARLLSNDPWVIALTGLGAFLGHLYPLYFGFRGGKGIATAAGVFMGISPLTILVLLVIWLLTALITRYSSLAGLVATALSPAVIFFLLGERAYLLIACVIAVFVFWRHRTNIQRLLKGEESRIRLFGRS